MLPMKRRVRLTTWPSTTRETERDYQEREREEANG